MTGGVGRSYGHGGAADTRDAGEILDEIKLAGGEIAARSGQGETAEHVGVGEIHC